MDRRKLGFIALAVSMLYGAGFAVFADGPPTWYAVFGAVIVALAWISVGVVGRDQSRPG